MLFGGEYLFHLPEEALGWLQTRDSRTDYERRLGISVIGYEWYKDSGDIKFLKRVTSDGRWGFFIIFKNSLRSDIWKLWCPSDNQLKFLIKEIPDIVMECEKQNIRASNETQLTLAGVPVPLVE